MKICDIVIYLNTFTSTFLIAIIILESINCISDFMIIKIFNQFYEI